MSTYSANAAALGSGTVPLALSGSLTGKIAFRDGAKDYPSHIPGVLAEFKRIRHLFYGDFYPLTPYSVANDTWLAYQFHQPKLNQGMILAFRRPHCESHSRTVKLWGLSPHATYEVHFEDTNIKKNLSGKQLSEGLEMSTEQQPGSLLITYRRAP